MLRSTESFFLLKLGIICTQRDGAHENENIYVYILYTTPS
jgi:hypothetical protein